MRSNLLRLCASTLFVFVFVLLLLSQASLCFPFCMFNLMVIVGSKLPYASIFKTSTPTRARPTTDLLSPFRFNSLRVHLHLVVFGSFRVTPLWPRTACRRYLPSVGTVPYAIPSRR